MKKADEQTEKSLRIINFLSNPIIITNKNWVSICYNKAFKRKFKLPDGVISIKVDKLFNTNLKLSKIDSNKKAGISGDLVGLTNSNFLNIARLEDDMFLIEVMNDKADELLIFQSMIMDIPGNIYWMSSDNTFQGCNKQQAISAGLKAPDEIIGKKNADMLWKNQAAELDKINNRVMDSRKAITRIETAEMYDQHGVVKKRTYQSSKMPIIDTNDEVIGILGVSLDITELKEAQEKMKEALGFAEEAERRRKQFLSNQEHDINTALTGVIYSGDAFHASFSEEGTEDFLEMADMISRCGRRLQAYNRSLLKDLCWLDNEGKLVERRADIRAVFDKLYDINFLAAKANGTRLVISEIDDNVPKYLMVDDVALFQCLQDLVGNAVNFTKDGKITVSVKLPEPSNKDMPIIAFHVSDTGRGIKEEHQRYIFEDFYKVLPSNVPDLEMGVQADEDKGRGLGLTVSKKKAEVMGGELHLEWSREGEGSEFVLTLPLKPALNQGGQ